MWLLAVTAFLPFTFAAAKPKVHTVSFGGGKRVPYSVAGDPAGNNGEEKELKIRPLLIDEKVKEWTTGEAHDVTDRSVAVRRALRLNDALPTDKSEHWVWQRGPWLLIDRTNGKVTALHLPDFDPTVSNIAWFRDYAAYCGLSGGGKQLYAVVAQVAAKKPLLMKKIATWDLGDHPTPACSPASWQREPLQVTFTPTKAGAPVSYSLVGLSAVLVEDGDENGEDP
ncbi:hypothetical protein ACPOL_1008 [Acidisarcina polymorpha]|uniref:Uncharacterized protein n=1 Tax=Acidisarcina polymorpha TaxID=2211140 RepID=A0A2Z5FU27_9BACT|nr:hypothetical protein ACPOL_1008 [Acidisarcina polymorpha]